MKDLRLVNILASTTEAAIIFVMHMTATACERPAPASADAPYQRPSSPPFRPMAELTSTARHRLRSGHLGPAQRPCRRCIKQTLMQAAGDLRGMNTPAS